MGKTKEYCHEAVRIDQNDFSALENVSDDLAKFTLHVLYG